MSWLAEVPCRGSTGVFFGPVGESPIAYRTRFRKARAVCAECAYTGACERLMRGHGGFWAGRDHDGQGWPMKPPDEYGRPGPRRLEVAR